MLGAIILRMLCNETYVYELVPSYHPSDQCHYHEPNYLVRYTAMFFYCYIIILYFYIFFIYFYIFF